MRNQAVSALMALVVTAATGTTAVAQVSYQWDTTTSGTVVTDGAGTWQEGVGNWRTGTSTFTYDQVWANGNNATFGTGDGGAAGTVTLGGNITTSLARINSGFGGTSYTIDLNGNTWNLSNALGNLDFTGTSEIRDSAGGGALIPGNSNIRPSDTVRASSLTISAKVTGGGRVFVSGNAGVISLTNKANDFTGILAVQNSTEIAVSSIGNSGVASAAGAGTELQWGQGSATITYTGTGDSTNRQLTYSGGAAAATLKSNGTGPLVCTGSFSNQISASKAFVLAGSNTNRNQLQSSLTNNGANVLSITKNDVGTWVLSGTNTYTGATAVNGGILVFGGTQAKAPATVTAGAAGTIGLGVGGANAYTSGNVTSLFANTLTGFSMNAASGVALDTTGGNFTYAMPASTSRNLTKLGTNALTLTGGYSQSGTTSVLAGGLFVAGTNSGAGLVSVASGAWVGGSGSLAGGLTLAAGGLLAFDPLAGLNVSGAVTLDNSFGVASLVGANGSAINWSSIADGTYTLIGQTSSTFNTIQNFGANNAASIGGGRTAYFQNGSLQLVIVPEPGGLALAGLGAMAAGWAAWRRSLAS